MTRAAKQIAALARPAGIYLLFAALVAIIAEFMLEAARTGGNWAYLGDFLVREIGVVAVGTLVLMLLVGGLLAVTGRMWLSSSLVLSLTLLLGVASHLKYAARREPIYPRDLAFMFEPRFLLEMIQPKVLWLTLLGFVPLILFTWGLSKLFKLWLHRRTTPKSRRWRTTVLVSRGATALLSLVLLSSLLNFNHTGNPWRVTFESAGAHWAKASQPNNYRVNGFLGGFLYNLDIPAMARPQDYSRAAIQRIVEKYTAVAEEEYAGTEGAMDDVNVVSVLSESFSDPTQLAGLEFAEDPIPRTRELMEQVPHGRMLAQKIGGGTSSMEFETLTGMSLAQFNSAMDTPYQMLIPNYRHFPSAVEMFNQLGHETLAIHPYDETMYQRDHVYPVLGFDDFISRKDMTYRGRRQENPYIADMAAFYETLDAIDATEAPLFVNLVTMQNHAPYAGKYEDPIGVEGVSGASAESIGQYARGLMLSDRAIARFVNELERSDEKTIVVVYGDHRPAGMPESVYEKNSDRVMHETPFFIYSNFDDLEPVEYPTTSPIFFLPHVFELVGAPMPPYYAMLSELEEQVSAMQHGTVVSHWDYDLAPEQLTPEAQELLHDYRLVQYDLSVGQRWAEKMLYPDPADTLKASAPSE